MAIIPRYKYVIADRYLLELWARSRVNKLILSVIALSTTVTATITAIVLGIITEDGMQSLKNPRLKRS